MRYSKPDARPCGPTDTISSPMPCGPVANRVPYPLVADGLSAGIPYATPVGGATDFIPCALRPRPLLQSVAHPQVGVHSGYSRKMYAYARLAHYSPYLSLSRRVPTTPPTINGNFHSGYSRLTVNLRSAGHLFSLLITFRRPFPGMAVSVMPIPAWLSEATRSYSARSNHRAPFFTMLVSPLRTSYVPISSGPMVESCYPLSNP